MGRLALRPGLRAYAHAQAGADAEEFSPASIPQTVLWIDAADDAYRTMTGSYVATIKDKGWLNAAGWAAAGGAGTLTENQTFTLSTTASTHSLHEAIAGKGNGNKFFVLGPTGAYLSSRGWYTPSASPYNLTTGAGSAAVEADWLLWQLYFIADDNTYPEYLFFARGDTANSPADMQTVFNTSTTAPITGDWGASGGTTANTWATSTSPVPWVVPRGSVGVLLLQSYDDGGARTYRMSQNGSTWAEFAHGETNGSPSAASNEWRVWMKHHAGPKTVALGEAGFCGGAVSDADIASLYSYLDDKWDIGT